MSQRHQKLVLDFLDEHLPDHTLVFRINGNDVVVGRGNVAPTATIEIASDKVFSQILGYGTLGLGEAFMEGKVKAIEGELHEFLTLCLQSRLDRSLAQRPGIVLQGLMIRASGWLQGVRKNVRAHYDQGDDLFESFLDSSLGYSCAYAYDDADPIEKMQWQKYERICQKLRVEAGHHVLDIGCGFGGLLIHAARHHSVTGLGITNSANHAALAREKCKLAGVADKIEIRCEDFSKCDEPCDRFVSVGMLEHVPRSQYGQYFNTVKNCLKPDGRGLIHAIGCNTFRNRHDPFIQKYIFPGSNQVRLSELDWNARTCPLWMLKTWSVITA